MLQFEPDIDVAIFVEFTTRNQPFIPGAGSAKWSLLGNDGAPMAGYIDTVLTLAATDTYTTITVPAAANDIAPAARFENRTLVVKALAAARPWTLEIPFILTPRPNITASPSGVRAYIGVDADELPDGDIDVFSAYLEIDSAIGTSVLETALASGGLNQIAINKSILAQAVLNVLPALQQRLLLSSADGSLSATRNKLNLKSILEKAKADLQDGIDKVLGRAPTASPFFIIGTVVDPITGV